jgi:LuxR family maltose regulon positive regulatory protein
MDMTYEEITVAVVKISSREARLKYPIHFLKHAFNLLDVGRRDIFAEACAEFEETVETGGLSENERRRLLGELTLLSSFGDYNDITKMASAMKRAHELTGGQPSLIRKNDTWTFGNASVLFMYHSEPGRLDEELSEMKEGCGYYFALTDGHGFGGDELMKAEARLCRGDLRGAESSARAALRRAEGASQNSVAIGAYLPLAIAALLSGDSAGVSEMREGIFKHRGGGLLVQRSDREESDLAGARLALMTGHPENVREWIRGWNIDAPATRHIQSAPYAQVLYGEYWLAVANTGGDRAKSARVWLDIEEEAVGVARGFRSVMSEIYCHILSARARSLMGERGVASASLDSALSLALPDRLMMPFAEHYSEISRLLAENARLARHDSCLKEIEALAERLEDGRRAYARSPNPTVRLALSEQDCKIACLAAKGLKNAVIAGMLFLAEKTIRNRMSFIYDHLGTTRENIALVLDNAGMDWRSVT